jgi:hypothetical protein
LLARIVVMSDRILRVKTVSSLLAFISGSIDVGFLGGSPESW